MKTSTSTESGCRSSTKRATSSSAADKVRSASANVNVNDKIECGKTTLEWTSKIQKNIVLHVAAKYKNTKGRPRQTARLTNFPISIKTT